MDRLKSMSTDASITIDPATKVVPAKDVPYRLSLNVDIADNGPCKKHVRVKIPRTDVDHFLNETVKEMVSKASVPGFRAGHVPRKLVVKKYKKEVTDDVKQRLLLQSLEQLAEDNNLDAINEPDLDVLNLDLPDEGDFEYEFDVEVRPQFDLPNYKGLKIKRPVRQVSDADVDSHIKKYLAQFGQLAPHEGAAENGDFLTVNVKFTSGDKFIGQLNEEVIRVRPVLRFQDAEIQKFDELMVGVKAGETRQTQTTVSMEVSKLELRGETVRVQFDVLDVKRMRLPELNEEFLKELGVESEAKLRENVKGILERQVTYEQRQSARRQFLDQITESATWDLPESMVRRQVENAMRRELLEMQQAGFTNQEIRAKENELRQRQVSITRQALKEHFVLDKIAEAEKLEVAPMDIEMEITYMAMQQGESPRKVRSYLEKRDLMGNLEAQIMERKAIDIVLDGAVYEDVSVPVANVDHIESVSHAVCGIPETAEPEVLGHGHDHDHSHDHSHDHDHAHDRAH
jgi:trigger factor